MLRLILLLLLADSRRADVDLSTGYQACASSRSTVVRQQFIPANEEAVEKAVRKWSRFIEKKGERYCFTIILSPTDGTDGLPIYAPVVLVLRENAPIPEAEIELVPATPKGRYASLEKY